MARILKKLEKKADESRQCAGIAVASQMGGNLLATLSNGVLFYRPTYAHIDVLFKITNKLKDDDLDNSDLSLITAFLSAQKPMDAYNIVLKSARDLSTLLNLAREFIAKNEITFEMITLISNAFEEEIHGKKLAITPTEKMKK